MSLHRRRKLLKAGGAQEVFINFELFTRAKLLCGRGRHVKVGGAQAPVPPRFLRLCIAQQSSKITNFGDFH